MRQIVDIAAGGSELGSVLGPCWLCQQAASSKRNHHYRNPVVVCLHYVQVSSYQTTFAFGMRIEPMKLIFEVCRATSKRRVT